jgi:hypothetical protein
MELQRQLLWVHGVPLLYRSNFTSSFSHVFPASRFMRLHWLHAYPRLRRLHYINS